MSTTFRYWGAWCGVGDDVLERFFSDGMETPNYIDMGKRISGLSWDTLDVL